MRKTKIAIIGFGNVGHKVLEAVNESPDMEVAGIIELPAIIDKLKKKLTGISRS